MKSAQLLLSCLALTDSQSIDCRLSIDCGNGNQCAADQTCAGVSPTGNSTAANVTLFGRKYGCSPMAGASVCPGHRFSCPHGSACDAASLTCVLPDKNVLANATRNVDAYPTKLWLASWQGRNGGICEIIGGDLPSECSCKDDQSGYGGTIDCQEYIVLDTIGKVGRWAPHAATGTLVYASSIHEQASAPSCARARPRRICR